MKNSQRQSGSHLHASVPQEIKSAPSIGVPEFGMGELQPNPGADFEDFHSSFAEFHEGYVRHYIALADAKAAWSFTIVSGALIYLASQSHLKVALIKPATELQFAFAIAVLSLLAISAFFSFLVVAPRLNAPSGEGIVFFGAVALRGNSTEFVADVSAATSRDLTEARIKHCYDISRICKKKYDDLRAAFWIGLLGLLLSLISFVWI